MIPSDKNPSARQRLRCIISTVSHLDGFLSESGRRLPLDTEAMLKTDLERIYTELGGLSEDVEIFLVPPKEKKKASA
jgi:hypothetical protein